MEHVVCMVFHSLMYMTCRSRSSCVLHCPTRPLHICRGHSPAMWRAVWIAAPHSDNADCDSSIWLMLYLDLPQPVRIRCRRTSAYQVRSHPTSLFDGVWMNSLNRQREVSHLVSPRSLLSTPCWSSHERHW